MKQKGNAVVIILVLVVLAVAGYFGYKNWPKLQNLAVASPTPAAGQTPGSDLTNWKTYIHPSCGADSENFKFIIQFPPNFTEKDRSNERGYSYFVYSKADFDFEISCGPGRWLGCGHENKEIGGSFIINNKKNLGCLERNEANQTINFFIDYWNNNDTPRLFFIGEAKDSPENINLLNQILSTFKFTK